jgi:predicted dehydrogenase
MTFYWGIIGCGDISQRRVAPAIHSIDNCKLVAASRKNSTLQFECARNLGVKTVFTDWREMVRQDNLDAIYIAAPVFLHSEMVQAASNAGKHVLCEKPMAMTSEECVRMIDACRSNHVHLGIAYYRHFFPVIDRIKSLIASNAIGDVLLIQINAFETFLPGKDHPRHWIMEANKAGGGCLMDFGCHRIEILLNLLGDIRLASGVTGHIYPQYDVEDTAVVSLAFESGACGVVSVMRGGTSENDTLFIQGTRGTIAADVLNKGSLQITTDEGYREEKWPPHKNFHQPLIENFIKTIEEKRPFAVDGQVGLKVQDIITAIYQ